MKHWSAVCSTCANVTVAQKSKPITCKEQISTGERSIRRCGNELTEQQDTTAMVEAVETKQAHNKKTA